MGAERHTRTYPSSPHKKIFVCGYSVTEIRRRCVMKKDVAHRIAFIGVMSALIFVVLTLETYVFIGMLGINPAFLSLPLAIALCMFGDWKEEFYGGTIFGVCAFIISFMVAYVPMYNPLVSILPRVLMGVGAYWIYNLLSFVVDRCLLRREKKGKKPLSKRTNVIWRETVPAAVAGVCGALINTVLVLTMLFVFGGDAFAVAFKVAIAFNSPIEMVCCAVLVPVYVRVMKIALKTPDRLLYMQTPKHEENVQI